MRVSFFIAFGTIRFMHYIDIHNEIRNWYRRNGRDELPWRQTDDPYKIYISEMMLQQTQVKTVLERYYFPFLKRFPTLQSVAEASLDEVLYAWQGLGYYRRARYIHETAKIAAPDLPTDVESLVKLPGIGQSTAHAVAVFSTHAPVAVLDANVKRILYRFFAKERTTPKELWQMADTLLDREHPYEYNQAMMDIGAMVCLPKAPKCDTCPLSSRCQGKEDPLKYPAKKAKKSRKSVVTHYLWIEKAEKILMIKRHGELLGGLYELPAVEEVPEGLKPIAQIVHDYTHFRRIAKIYRLENDAVEGEWIEKKRLDEIAVSSLEKKIFKALGIGD